MRVPTSKLLNYSLMLSVAVAIFFLISISLYEMHLLNAIYRALVGGLLLLVTSLISIAIIRIYGKRYGIAKLTWSWRRYFTGWIATFIVVYIYQYVQIEIGKLELFPRDRYLMYSPTDWQFLVMIFLSSWLVYSLVHILHNSVLLQHLRTVSELEMSRLRSTNLETTNQLLKQQIQPHFLFNALNVLKSLIKSDPQLAEGYLIRLSDFLRMSFSKSKKSTSTVRDEIKLCKDYLEMQKIRFSDALEYRFEIPQSYYDLLLPVCSLQPLAENAIKHNEFTEEDPLFIRVIGEQGVLKVENNLRRRSRVEHSTGNGLSNLSERYQILSGGENINISDDGTTFIVSLKPIAYENSDH